MKIISSTVHGFIDYATAFALIAAPFIVFPAGAPAAAFLLSIGAGVSLVIYSLITDYSISARKAVPFKVHLLIDFLAGVTFIAAPFVLGFYGVTKTYFLVMGAAVVLVVLLTDSNTKES